MKFDWRFLVIPFITVGCLEQSPAPEDSFEDVVTALSPVAIYNFRDTDFSVIADSSGNGHDLISQYADAARETTNKIRSTHPGPAYFPYTTYANWFITGSAYKTASAVEAALDGKSGLTVILSIRMGDETNYSHTLLGLLSGAPTGAAYHDWQVQLNPYPSATVGGQLQGFVNSSAGTQAAPNVGNGVESNKLYILRWASGSKVKMTMVDPSQSQQTEVLSVSTLGGTFPTQSPDWDLWLNPPYQSAWPSYEKWIDHISIFDGDIGDTAEDDIIAAWTAEAL